MKTCAICKSHEETEHNQLQRDDLYLDIYIHWQCQASTEYQEWVNSQRLNDPLYDRYWDMMTVGKPIECSHCGEQQAISPKAVGMGAGIWDLNCTHCHQLSTQPLNGYTDDANYQQLERLRNDFICSRDLELMDERIAAISASIESVNRRKNCRCGGQFSLMAKPRCVKCNAVLIDSYFHVSFKPLVPAEA